MNLPVNILLMLASFLPMYGACAEVKSIEAITVDDIGEFVTTSGTVTAYYPQTEARAPYSFSIRNQVGSTIRVSAWPDIFELVNDRELLQTTGTVVHVTAEVAEYKDKLELHLQDWNEIDISPETTSSLRMQKEKVTSPTVSFSKPES